jgi:hypothetical protein
MSINSVTSSVISTIYYKFDFGCMQFDLDNESAEPRSGKSSRRNPVTVFINHRLQQNLLFSEKQSICGINIYTCNRVDVLKPNRTCDASSSLPSGSLYFPPLNESRREARVDRVKVTSTRNRLFDVDSSKWLVFQVEIVDNTSISWLRLISPYRPTWLRLISPYRPTWLRFVSQSCTRL